VNAPSALLNNILRHFSNLADKTADFLANVAYLERELKQTKLAKWTDYQARKRGSAKTYGVGCRCPKG